MPLAGGRYRIKTTPAGAQIRLHFTQGGAVNEATNLGTGAVHTPQEFAQDLKKRGARLKQALITRNMDRG